MAWFIYSPESFPGEKGSGRDQEFCRVKGHIIVVPERKWLPLKPRYERLEQGMPTSADGKSFSKTVRTAEEMAERLVEKYGHMGLVATRSESDLERNNMEKKALKTWEGWIDSVIEGYESERREGILTSRGLRGPTVFEKTCFTRRKKAVTSDAQITAQVSPTPTPVP